MLEISWKQ